MLKKLHKRENTNAINLEPSEGERTLLCSNESGMRSPSLDLLPDLTSEEMLLDQLASILVDIFLAEENAKHNLKKSSNILPGIDETSG